MSIQDANSPSSPVSLIKLATDIVGAYVSNNAMPIADLPQMIRSVHTTLSNLTTGTKDIHEPTKPAISIKKSITPEFIICLEDGKKLKMLKRYLRSRYGLSPDDYRTKWGLPSDYPMVAPNYAARRSEFAKKIGLGRTQSIRPKAKKRIGR